MCRASFPCHRTSSRTPGGRGGDRGHDSVPVSACLTGQMHSIHLDTVIAAPIGEGLRLSLSVDAHAASMHASGEQAIGGATSGATKLGEQLTWRARHFGIVFPMTSAITEY